MLFIDRRLLGLPRFNPLERLEKFVFLPAFAPGIRLADVDNQRKRANG
jgi:hypothetical protein